MGYLKLTATSCACLIALIVVENKACTKSSYFDRHPGIHLQGQVIRTVTTCPSGIWNCIIECGKTPGCLSINSHNTGNVTHCDLNKSNRYGKQANVIKTTLDREYLEIVFNPDWSDACLMKDGWYRNKSAAYKFVNEAVSYQVARQRCQTMSAGADLVSIVNSEEEQIFQQYLEGFGDWGAVWIGFNDIAMEGTFVWVDGTKSGYTNWRTSSNEPNNADNNEDCAVKVKAHNGQWNDDGCFKNISFACKTLCT